MNSEMLGAAQTNQRNVACRNPLLALRGATYALGVVASLCLGCEAPDLAYGDCEVTCESRCPSGMQCTNGFCVHPDSQRACLSIAAHSGGATSAEGKRASAGAAMQHLPSGEVVGSVDVRSESSVIGQGTDGRAIATSGGVGIGGTGASIGSLGSASSASNAGSTARPGGGGAYTSGTGGFVGGSSGTGGAAGTFFGGTVSTPTCTEPLVVTSLQLPNGCVGEQYQASLTASSDNLQELEWAVAFPEGSGLALSANVILGVLGAAGNYPLEVSVRNKRTLCSSAPVVVVLTVHGETALNCPTIGIAGNDSSLTPPAPSCLGWPYRISFEARGVKEPYDLSVLEFPPGQFQYDASSHSVQGTPTSSGSVTVQLRDGTQRVVQKTFPIPLRDKCWLAFVSQELSGDRLHLLDPLLKQDVVRPRAEDMGASVLDFRFSPNGRFLAYRIMDVTGNHQLRLWQGPDWQREQVLDLESGATVQHYSWSGNSRTLAVAYEIDGITKLGGVDVTAVPEQSAGTGLEGLVVLAPTNALVQSEPVWFAADTYVAYHRPDSPGSERVVEYAAYGPLGFSAPHPPGSAWFDPSVVLLPSANGFFAEDVASAYVNYYDVGRTGWIGHGNDAIAPSGLYTAHTAQGELQLFRAFDDSEFDATPYARSNGCSAILAWSRQQERIACIDHGQNRVQIHTLANTNLVAAALEGSEGYASAAWFNSRRSLSPSGNWLALTTPKDVYVGSLAHPLPQVLWQSRLPESVAPKGLSFSPDEQLLLLHSGQSLRVFTLASASGEVVELGRAREEPEPCHDETLPIPNWCGNGESPGGGVWSSDSQLVAFVNEQDVLVVRDLRIRPVSLRSETIEVHAPCRGACTTGFRFQP